MQKTIANILLAATGFACFLALNSFSLWGFALLPETALGENAQLLWSAPLSLSNMLTFFVFVIGAYCAPTLFNRSPLPSAAALLTAAVTLMGHAHPKSRSSHLSQHVHGHRHNMLLLLLGTCFVRGRLRFGKDRASTGIRPVGGSLSRLFHARTIGHSSDYRRARRM